MSFKNIFESVNTDKLSKDIHKVLIKHDENLSIQDFAKSIGKIIAEYYGEHNYNTFEKIVKQEIKNF